MPDKFIVPQFIDSEDKILGPITVRQFIICLVSVLIIFIAYRVLAFPYFVGTTVVICGVAGTVGFVKVNGQPFHVFMLNALQTLMRPPLRLWDKRPTDAELRQFMTKAVVAPVMVSERKERPESTRLRDLSLVVNTGGVYKPEDNAF